MLLVSMAVCAVGQTLTSTGKQVRFVDGTNGKYENSGKSWVQAKKNIQDAINDLHNNNLEGEVWVKAGTYSPTESTESTGGSTLYMSFKIYKGITVRGGFAGNETTELVGSEVPVDKIGRELTPVANTSMGATYAHKTILTGNIGNAGEPNFTWSETKQRFNTEFYGNCYHVVTFATNGFDASGRANPLGTTQEIAAAEGHMAMLEGFDIKNGNAKNAELEGHPHNAYGGGIYMVNGATVENVNITHCEASRDGGAIYMDGGGVLRHSYISECQALGSGLESGYGGAVCIDENKQIYPPQMARNIMVNCVARYGGGLATKINNPNLTLGGKQMKHNTGIAACLITNCTATTEGGGVYAWQGGGFTQMTIVNNKCNGSGTTVNGIKSGQSAGIYIRDNAIVANCILWGGKTATATDANKANSAQMAFSRSKTEYKPQVLYTALSNADYVDWSGTYKEGIIKLCQKNRSDGSSDHADSEGHVYFLNPSSVAGYEAAATTKCYDWSAADYYKYQVSYGSSTTNAGIHTNDLDVQRLTPVKRHITDLLGNEFTATPTLGAYKSAEPSMMASIEKIGDTKTIDEITYDRVIAHIYVDPNTSYVDDVHYKYAGRSWKAPIKSLSDAFDVLGNLAVPLINAREKGIGDSDGKGGYLTITPMYFEEIQIHVKEGTMSTVGAFNDKTVRANTLRVPKVEVEHRWGETNFVPVTILGGYDKDLTTNADPEENLYTENTEAYYALHQLDKRNPILTPTIITGEIMQDYKYSIPHIWTVEDVQNVTIDGFQVKYANASSTELENSVKNGAAFTINKATGISLKNIRISGCTADNGAAVYATNGSTVSLENCIIHNNQTTYTETSGNLYCDETSSLTLDHCDVLRNVGYAFYAPTGAKVAMTNSIVYANMSVPVEDTNLAGVANVDTNPNDRSLVAFKGAGTYSGHTNLFDLKSKNQVPDAMHIDPWLQFNFEGGTNTNYPFFVNPTKNAGVSISGDATYYGRGVNFQPHNGNPMVNNAYYEGTHDTWGTDMSCVTTRDFGGLPDIGAVENHIAQDDEGEIAYKDGMRAYGEIMYVRDYGADKEIDGRDGSSWEHAINGNGLYPNLNVINGYRLKYTEGDNTYYVDKTKIDKAVAGGHPTLGRTSTIANAEYFTFSNLSGGTTTTTTIKANSNNMYFNRATTNNTYYMWLYSSGTAHYLVKNNDTYYIYANVNGKNWYLYFDNNNQLAYTDNVNNKINWTLDPVTDNTLNGLQYAVNSQSKAFSDDSSKHPREVWVGAGTYSKDPEYGDDNCFVIRDGVNVFGAFPKVGNPGKEQRQALVSQYVKIVNGYNSCDYETILEPKTSVTDPVNVKHRVLGQPYQYNPDTNTSRDVKYIGHDYIGASWDGFTLRNGVYDANGLKRPNRYGGGGAAIYKNVTLRNVVVTNNLTIYSNAKDGQDFRAGGIYMDGGTLEQGYVINNKLQGWNSTQPVLMGAAYGGGMYIYSGTVFNSVIANNYNYSAHADGAGLFMENATFFNNTIVNNKSEFSKRGVGGISIWTSGASSKLTVYNSIIANNIGYKSNTSQSTKTCGDKDIAVQNGGAIELYNCFSENNESSTSTGNSNGLPLGSITFDNCVAKTGDDLTAVFKTLGTYESQFNTLDLRLADGSAAINKGIDNPTIGGVTYNLDVYNDMDFSDRIKDCTIDIGAYEYNDAYAITPDTNEDNKAIFYVTPMGMGTASASDPLNAACAAKLQKVLDAAGRYKYNNPSKQVIVKVANSKSNETNGTPFKYYAGRTIDYSDQDIRVWSIDIPRGVEVWGGYSDCGSTGTYKEVTDVNNGFYSVSDDVRTDLRDILGNPTYFDASYYNKVEKQNSTCYHAVSFTDKVYDGEGHPYITYYNGTTYTPDLEHNSPYDPNSNNDDNTWLSMASVTQDRAVIDGIFISGGKADIAATKSGDKVNMHQYGGAAIVTSFAHVRNCIARGNKAIYGGALALTDGALVSGTLIDQNEAQYGGALYVFEDDTKLSDGTNISTGKTAQTVNKMPKIITSTIANNKATKQGGGIWFTSDYANVRLNSTLLWKNDCNDAANVSGNYAPVKADNDLTKVEDFYPFAYSAVENMRLSGTNNIPVKTPNSSNVRFGKKSGANATDHKTLIPDPETSPAAYGYYLPTNYSTLLRTGMPLAEYDKLVTDSKLSITDFAGVEREIALQSDHRTYIDIGARALDKVMPASQLMLRLFVAQPEDVNVAAAEAMMKLDPSTVGDDEKEKVQYYSQEGSSFAYPFQNLQDALDYIYTQRSGTALLGRSTGQALTNDAINLPFEIMVAKGTYYPTRDLAGHYGQSLGNTFAIPEGVSIYGGFDVNELETNQFYGRYYKPADKIKSTTGKQTDAKPYYIKENVTKLTGDATLGDYTFIQTDWKAMANARKRYDANSNDIIEPWEFANETILSGNAMSNSNKGVYHVVTIVPDQNVVGMLPKASIERSKTYSAEGYHDFEEGQPITLNGLKIEDGYAHTYNDEALDNFSKYSYYHGGAILIDGNRYCDDFNKWTDEQKASNEDNYGKTVYKHTGVSNAIGYRDIPLAIVNCWLRNNKAGYGGAISGNNTIDIIASSIENNLAEGFSEKVNATLNGEQHNNLTVSYPGQGGAVYSTAQVTAINTLFANNEARAMNTSLDLAKYPTLRNQNPAATLGGCGGAIFCGKAGFIHMVNSDVVRNMANVFPAVFTMNPNKYGTAEQDVPFMTNQYTQFINSVFWGNEVSEAMWNANKSNTYFNFNAPLICNYAAKDRTDAYTFNWNSQPTSQTSLDALMDVAWFSAYEEGRGITPNNTLDLREADYKPYLHGMTFLAKAATAMGGNYQNCNITIASDNDVLEGPNFVAPSKKAGNAGYTESADWSPARLNKLTDMGSGKITQVIKNTNYQTYSCKFPTYSEAEEPVPTERALYSCETENDFITSGAYTVTRYLANFPNYNYNLAVGNEFYMQSAYADNLGKKTDFFRISYDPNPTHNKTYIDIGVYEYRHTPLTPEVEGDECDILWVSNVEKPANGAADGQSWSTPTSDLQRAIETLLSSRNGHRKEIRLMDGTYTPIYTIKDHLSFYIDTKYLNESVVLPSYGGSGVTEGLGVKSFTIKGGYSKDLNNIYDPALYPAIIKGQKRMNETGTQWDHAIYIGDATQRYGIKTGYSADNGYGWWASTTDQTDKPAPNTIPIQIDGVTVVNENALANAKGAAIYYADQSFTKVTADPNTSCVQTDEESKIAYRAIVPTSANISVIDENGVRQSPEAKTNPAKLIISKTKVYGSGAPDIANTGSAVYIGQYGGKALIYNNVFHSNYGDPLVAYATKTINNTIALNKGQVKLMTGSTIMNSALWKNNNNGEQFTLEGLTLTDENLKTCGTIFSHNAYTGGSNATDYDNADDFIKTHNYNVGLKDENSDAIYGPNFMDPENATIALRDFTLKPSLRLLNHGETTHYNDNIYEYAWVPTTSIDAAGKTRINSKVIDLGAYEFQSDQNRILYVIPSNMVSSTGLSWSEALGYGKIQAAIDLAAVYYKTYNKEAYVFVRSSDNKEHHTGETLTLRNGVSVYGSIDANCNEVCPPVNTTAPIKEYTDAAIAKYVAKVTTFHRSGIINPRIGHTRINGINTNGTAFDQEATCKLDAGGTCVPTALIDGFEVTNNGAKITAPAININPKKSDTDYADGGLKMCLRNIVVDGNDYSEPSGTESCYDLVNINNALLYECLIHSNKVKDDNASALKLGTYGYAVNVTVEGKTTGADGEYGLNNVKGSIITGSTVGTEADCISANSPASHVFNSITNYADDEPTWKTLSGYCYKMYDANLNYQLTENSKYIDAIEQGSAAFTLGTDYMPTTLRGFINYQPTVEAGKYTGGDRDLLGNFRLQTLGGKITGKSRGDYTAKLDRGAFETWKVVRDVENVYPDFVHDGSVLYIMEGKSLIVDPVESTGDDNATASYPGFVLLQKGANFYGNGRAIMANYVAVERNVKSVGSVVAMPYKMNFAPTSSLTEQMNTSVGVAEPSYSPDGITQLPGISGATYRYNGANRANWKHEFHKELADGDCWDVLDEAANASEGILFMPTIDSDKTLRFTACGTTLDDYIYKEEVQQQDKHQKKTVTLIKYDDSESTNGGADFTEAEDQGWNCIGIPYLVSDYSTISNVTATEAVHGTSASGYLMQNPHTMWLYYNGTKYADGTTDVNGNGGFYSVSSWDDSDWHLATAETAPTEDKVARIWAGEGFFVQNQKFSGDETLTFYRPVAPSLTGAGSAKTRSTTRYYYGEDIKKEELAEELDGDISINVRKRVVTIRGLEGGENIRIYDAAGRTYNIATATEYEFKTGVPTAGIFLISVDNKVKKVMVK